MPNEEMYMLHAWNNMDVYLWRISWFGVFEPSGKYRQVSFSSKTVDKFF